MLLNASSATAKEYYALDYFRNSTGTLATWIGRTCGRRFHSCPLGNRGDRFSDPANPRTSALNKTTATTDRDYKGGSGGQLSLQSRTINMNKLQIKGSWNEIKGKLKQTYAQLTGDDLKYTAGKEDELIGRLQKKLGKSADEVRRIIES